MRQKFFTHEIIVYSHLDTIKLMSAKLSYMILTLCSNATSCKDVQDSVSLSLVGRLYNCLLYGCLECVYLNFS